MINLKKILSIILIVVMIVSVIPITSNATTQSGYITCNSVKVRTTPTSVSTDNVIKIGDSNLLLNKDHSVTVLEIVDSLGDDDYSRWCHVEFTYNNIMYEGYIAADYVCITTESGTCLGDVNDDGYLSALDARLILQVVAGLKAMKDLYFSNADVNDDNNLTATDARIILRAVTGLGGIEGSTVIPYEGETIGDTLLTVDEGDIVTVTVTLSEKSGLGGATLKLNYDSDVFEINSMEAGSLDTDSAMKIVNPGNGVVSMATSTTFESAGDICTIELVALKDTDSTISLIVVEAFDNEFESISDITSKFNISFSDSTHIDKENIKLEVSADKTNVKIGEIITVTVKLPAKSGLGVLTLKAKYNSSVLEIVDMKTGDLGAIVNKNTGMVSMASATTFEDAGIICTITFKALKANDDTVTFDVQEAVDADFNTTNVDVGSINVTVEENDSCVNGHTWGEWEEVDGENVRICSICGFTQFENYDVNLEVSTDKTNVKIGDLITVTVKLPVNSGLAVLTLKAKYDVTVLEATEMKAGDLGATVNVKTGIATMAASETFEKAGVICTLTFKAIKDGTADITFNVLEAVDENFESMTIFVDTATVKIITHIWGDWEITRQPTCKENGVNTRICTICGEAETQSIPATGHKYTTAVTSPTCTEQGYTTHTCICGDTYISDYTDATGHAYSAVVTRPTCTDVGFTTYTCACGDTYKSDYTSATGHAYSVVVTRPTCIENGYTTFTCACGDTYNGNYTNATGHNINADGECENCDYVEEKAPQDDCSCNCHKSGIANFFFKFALFFQKLFGANKTCDCGVSHY